MTTLRLLDALLSTTRKTDGGYRFAEGITARLVQLSRSLSPDERRAELLALFQLSAAFATERDAPDAAAFVRNVCVAIGEAHGMVLEPGTEKNAEPAFTPSPPPRASLWGGAESRLVAAAPASGPNAMLALRSMRSI